MDPRRLVAQLLGILGVTSAAAVGITTAAVNAHTSLTANYGGDTGTWVEDYAAFLAGTEELFLIAALQPTTILLSLAFVHAAWQRNLTVLTVVGAAATTALGASITVGSPLAAAARLLCPVCATTGTGVDVPAAALAVSAAVFCNLDVLVKRLTQSSDDESRQRPPSGGKSSANSTPPALSKQELWSLSAKAAGYMLVVACLVIGLGVHGPYALFSGIGATSATGLIIYGFVVYEFVSTNSLLGTAGLAAGAWVTGVAALQYDGALPGVALPAAVLLTLAAVGLWLDGR